MTYPEQKQLTIKLAKLMGVYSRTNRTTAVIRMSVVCTRTNDVWQELGINVPHLSMHLNRVMCAIKWGLNSGRLSLNAEEMISSLSGYQYVKLVIMLALMTGTDQTVIDYLNGKISLEYTS